MEKTPDKIDYIVHEGIVTRQERHIKRLWVLCLVIFFTLIATNAAWIVYENQFEDMTITQDVMQDSGDGGTNNYRGNVVGGDLNGEAKDQDEDHGAQTENGW